MKQHRNGIRLVAQKNKVSEEEVIREIENCIREARETAYKERNQNAIRQWERIPARSEVPSAEEFITYIVNRIRNE